MLVSPLGLGEGGRGVMTLLVRLRYPNVPCRDAHHGQSVDKQPSECKLARPIRSRDFSCRHSPTYRVDGEGRYERLGELLHAGSLIPA